MKCTNCNEEVGDCKICPFCNHDLTATTKTTDINNAQKENAERNKDRTMIIIIFKYILIAILAIFVFIGAINNNFIIIGSCIAGAIGIYTILTVFETIIDLLQEINNKLK